MGFGSCVYCGWTGNLHSHHIQHKSKGGADNDENLVCICPNCHHDEHCRSIYKLEMFGETREMWDSATKNGYTNIASPILDEYLPLPLVSQAYMALKRLTVSHDGYIGATIDDIAKIMGISRATALKARKELIKAKLLTRSSIKQYRQGK